MAKVSFKDLKNNLKKNASSEAKNKPKLSLNLKEIKQKEIPLEKQNEITDEDSFNNYEGFEQNEVNFVKNNPVKEYEWKVEKLKMHEQVANQEQKFQASKTKEIDLLNYIDENKKPKTPKKNIHRFYLSDDIANELEKIAKEQGVSKSDVLTALIKKGLSR